MEIKELTNKEFKDFTKHYKLNSLYQTPEYGFVMNEENFDTVFLGLVDNNKILAASLILIGKRKNFKYAYAPRGFLIDYSNYAILEKYTSLIKKYLSKLSIVSLTINPLILKDDSNYNISFNNLKRLKYKHLGYNDFFEGIKPRFEVAVDINKSHYNLFNDIKKEFKTKIRSAEKMGIKVYKGSANKLDYLYTHTEKKYPRKMNYYKNIYQFFKNNAEFYYAKLDTVKFLKEATDKVLKQEQNCRILTSKNKKDVITIKMEKDLLLSRYKYELEKANKLLLNNPDGILLASCLIIKNKKEVYLLMDGYNKQYKRLNAKHIMLWKLIEKYSKEGYKTFNLGGLPNPEKHSSKYDGLKEFKLSFNGKILEYSGDFELIINKPLYLLAKK